jgi:ectoine hydroxylase-related dioxygenase (phytanoyl-CoA dioxygenase family)
MSIDIVNLPDLSTPHAVDDALCTTFERDGAVVLESLCSAEEIAAYRACIAAAVERLNTETRPLEQRDTYGRAFLQIKNIWLEDDAVARFSMARRFARVAADLMGVDAVRMYHDQALYKEPGGGFTPWHQDRFYWPLDTDHTVTLWMPLVDVPAGMEFAIGSHRMQDLRGGETSDDSESYFSGLVSSKRLELRQVGPLRAGDATFHDGWMLHRAPGNDSERMREVMTVIYYADGTRVGPVDNETRKIDLEAWLPGLQPGDLAATAINPVLFDRRAEGS